MNCDNCYYMGSCQAWMTAKKPCSRFVSWNEVVAYLGGEVSFSGGD